MKHTETNEACMKHSTTYSTRNTTKYITGSRLVNYTKITGTPKQQHVAFGVYIQHTPHRVHR